VALPKGGTIELESSWWTKTLQTIRILPDGSELKKDLKLVDGGKGMEVKITAKVGGKKQELKLKYVKAE
jgi:hypothetical protein